MHQPYPLLLEPMLLEKIWGGRRLEHWGKRLPPDRPVGESWEVADLPPALGHDVSTIRNGPHAGRSLRWLMHEDAAAVIGAAAPTAWGGFPLLIKLLDAAENLSVQVHPSPAYAATHRDTHLKSEAWYILEAAPHAVIYAGLRETTSVEDVSRALERGTIVELMRAIPVRSGDCYHLPSGTVHALGAGIVVAEVQTPSDTTFRLFDWGRSGRELHITEALQSIEPAQTAQPAQAVDPFVVDGLRTEPLIDTEHFQIERISTAAAADAPVVTNGVPEVLLVVDGSLTVQMTSGPSADVDRGGTVLLPAGIGPSTVQFAPDTCALRIALPSPLSGWIA